MRFVYTLVTSLALCPFLYASPVDSAVWIDVTEANGEFHRGSGTVIACENGVSLIMTCAHITENGVGKFTVWLDGKTYDATYLSGSKVIIGPKQYDIEGLDLGFLTVKAKLPVSPFAKANAKVGDKVRQWGFAGGENKYGAYYKEGKVIKEDTTVEKDTIHSTADARAGDSGAALYNDKDEIIGVVNMRDKDQFAVGGYGVNVEDVIKYIVEDSKIVGFDGLKKKLKEK